MESAAELRGKIATYRGQLEQVNQLLEIDSSNEQFIGLKEDLEKVISLTENLLEQVVAMESAPATTTSSASANTTSGSYSPSGAAYDPEEAISTAIETTQSEAAVFLAKPFNVGDRIEVLGGARVFSGVVTSLLNDSECHIRYYEFPESEVKLPYTSLQPIPPGSYTRDQVVVGLQCQCKYASDLQYYAATVTGITQYGYAVTYTEYGNAEEVPLEYLRPNPALASTTTTTEADAPKETKEAKKELTLIAIPDNLQVLPTDTEEEKRRKYKKLKVIKNKNHQIQQELQVKEVQQSWQKFVQKGAKRPLSGISNKNSIFSSTEDTSSKVGVVNSGKGMTQFGERKRFKLDNATGEYDDE
eukprot:gene15306-10944_t